MNFQVMLGRVKGKLQIELMQFAEQYLKKNGFDVVPNYYVQHPILFRLEHIAKYGYDLVIDVGANIGQFAQEIRYYGYVNKIISFEPIHECFECLADKAKNDQSWIVINKALGDKTEHLRINISENLFSSSILKVGRHHIEAAQSSVSYKSQNIEVVTLDDIYTKIANHDNNVFLKIDTQGYELKVLTGAEKSLRYIGGIQIEMSMKELYEGQPLFYDVYQYLSDRGFKLISLEPSFINAANHEMLQVDGLFLRVA